MKNINEQIANAKTLEELAEVLNEYEAAYKEEGHQSILHGRDEPVKLSDAVDLCGLPTFGGEMPECTDDIFSWDETRVLTHSIDSSWSLEERTEEFGK